MDTQERRRSRRGEEGMVLIIAMVVMALITAMGVAALMMATLDASISGNYRTQRTGEVATDAALELTMAMIFSDEPILSLPINIDDTWTGTGDIAYQDPAGDLDVTINIVYKVEDSINYNTIETYADEVVRYGKDYNYADAHKEFGKQPVYTVTLTDNATGTRAEADVISQLGFKTPAAIFSVGTNQFLMRKNWWVTEEKIEVTSGAGTPALATTLGSASVHVQHAVNKWGPAGGVISNQPAGESWKRWDYTDNQGNSYYFAKNETLLPNPGSYLFDHVYTDAEIAAELAAGNYNNAREMQFCLLGVGDRTADLDVFATLPEAEAVFNFDQTDPAVVLYNYDMQGRTLEEMIGADFADFRDLADQVLTGDETVVDIATGANVPGKNLSGMTFGVVPNPQIVFIESNMDDDGNYTGGQRITLVTTGGSVQGYGILVINGDANIQGSFNWRGLMLVRGDLIQKPYQGGGNNDRSDFSLATDWNGWIMIGGDLDLWTYWGGTILLGYSTTDAAAIRDIIAATIPHKVLSWRKLYD